MASKVEADIVESVLHHPEYIKQASINPKWFQNNNFRAIYKSVSAYPLDGTDKWLTAAKAYGYTGNLNQISNMFDKREADDNLKTFLMDARSLEKAYLGRYIAALGASNRMRPQQETLSKLSDAIKQLTDIGNGQVKDQFHEAGLSMLHDLKQPKKTGIKTYSDLDHILAGGMLGGSLVTIGAGTGVGKTSFAINLAFAIANKDPEVRIDYISLEMSAREILDRFVSRATGASNYELRDPFQRIKSKSRRIYIAQMTKVLTDKHSNIHVYDKFHNLDEIASIIRQNARHCKPNKYIAIVDYIGLMDSGMNNMPRYLQIGHITRTFKMITESLNIPIIQLAQLSRRIDDADHQGAPKLSDLRESGSIEEDSNVVILLYKDKKLDKQLKNLKDTIFITVDVAKNRSGMTSKLTYLFLKYRMTFMNKRMIDNNPKSKQPLFNEHQVFKTVKDI